MNDYHKEKAEVAYFMRRLYEKGLTTTSGGNISLRCGDKVLITPSALDKGRLTGEQIGVMDMAGNIVGEPFKPTVESRLHLEIYRCRPDVGAVVHAHPVAASAFAASRAELRTDYLAESYVVLGRVGYAAYHCQGTEALAREVAGVAETHDCLLMRNHGALCVGTDLLQAFDRLEVLDAAARIELIARGALAGDAVTLRTVDLAELDLLIGRKN